MNKILNWVFGSFFRTLGRILVYILIGYLIFNLLDGKNLPNLFGVLNVNADEIKTYYSSSRIGGLRFNNINDILWINNNDQQSKLMNITIGFYYNEYTEQPFNTNDKINLKLRACMTGQTIASLNSSYTNQLDFVYNTGTSCSFTSWGGDIYEILMTANIDSVYYDDIDNPDGTVTSVWYVVVNSSSLYFYNTVGYNVSILWKQIDYMSVNDYSNYLTNVISLNKQNQIINGQNQIINGQSQINDSINNSDTSQATTNASNFFNNFSTNTHGLTGIITAPLTAIQSLTSASCSPLVLPLPFVNENLTLPCMRTIYTQYFGDFMQIYDIITLGIISYWVMVRIFGLVKDFKNPEHDEIEVVDL